MKKNGFTLVELLAVIAILAILVAIVMPNVMKEYNKAKASVFVTDSKSFMNAAMSEFTTDAMNHAGKTIYYSSKPNSDLNTSKLNIDSDKEYFIEMDRHGNFKRFVIYNESYCYDIFTTYGDASIGILDGTKSKNNNGQPINKESINENDVWDSGNDSIDITVTKNGNKIESYFVKGCDAGEHSYDDDINAETNIFSLYNVIKQHEEGNLVKKYVGSHKDSYNRAASYDIYYFSANSNSVASQILNKNNVLFANHCWQMIRTTDTGGVKLLYNGEVDSNGKCGTDRGTHVGYSDFTSEYFSYKKYYYGTDYKYDSSTNKFKLDGEISLVETDNSNLSQVLGKYTCKSSSSDATCSKIYYLYSLENNYGYVNLIEISNNSHYSQFGKLGYNDRNSNLSDVGYMNGVDYDIVMSSLGDFQSFYTSVDLYNRSIGTYYYYSNTLTYSNNMYSLNNPFKVSSSSELSSLVGKYTILSSDASASSSSVCYIASVSGSSAECHIISGGKIPSNFEYPKVVGRSIVKQEDGTYKLLNTVSVNYSNWDGNYSSYSHKYSCGSETSCLSPIYIQDTTSFGYYFISVDDKVMVGKSINNQTLVDTLLVSKVDLVLKSSNYLDYKYICDSTTNSCTSSSLKYIYLISNGGYYYVKNNYFSSDVQYINGKYKLINPVSFFSVYNDLNNISSYHYYCVNTGETECETVAYLFYYNFSDNLTNGEYVLLKNGEKVNDSFNLMLKGNVKDSLIKKSIDLWYEKYLRNYESYLEETIFCNNRSISNYNESGWNPNGGNIKTTLNFKEYSLSSDLTCLNDSDKFSISNSNAKLKYSIGLPSVVEMNLLNNNNLRKTSNIYWVSTPYKFHATYSHSYYIDGTGKINKHSITNDYGVRPMISLKAGTKFSSGDGSTSSPYVIE